MSGLPLKVRGRRELDYTPSGIRSQCPRADVGRTTGVLQSAQFSSCKPGIFWKSFRLRVTSVSLFARAMLAIQKVAAPEPPQSLGPEQAVEFGAGGIVERNDLEQRQMLD
jgi:hypothetical protein